MFTRDWACEPVPSRGTSKDRRRQMEGEQLKREAEERAGRSLGEERYGDRDRYADRRYDRGGDRYGDRGGDRYAIPTLTLTLALALALALSLTGTATVAATGMATVTTTATATATGGRTATATATAIGAIGDRQAPPPPPHHHTHRHRAQAAAALRPARPGGSGHATLCRRSPGQSRSPANLPPTRHAARWPCGARCSCVAEAVLYSLVRTELRLRARALGDTEMRMIKIRYTVR